MTLSFDRYRLKLFEKTMARDDYEYLYNQDLVAEGVLKIERRDERVFLVAHIKRTAFESFSSLTGQELSNNLRSMYDDLVKKLKNRK